jgi:hypothetical protein
VTQIYESCEAEVVSAQPLGMRAANGEEMYALVVRVLDGEISREIQIGLSVPANAMSGLRPGTTLRALRRPGSDYAEIVLDWETALRREDADEPIRQTGAQRRQSGER